MRAKGARNLDKDFQIAILKQVASSYPSHALDSVPELLEMAPGDTEEEKERSLIAHLKALERYGYIEDLHFRLSVDGFLSWNHAFRITEQGLIEAGEDILRPDPYRELRDALLEQAQASRKLSEGETQTFQKVLFQLPKVALERLRDRGLDTLLDLLFG